MKYDKEVGYIPVISGYHWNKTWLSVQEKNFPGLQDDLKQVHICKPLEHNFVIRSRGKPHSLLDGTKQENFRKTRTTFGYTHTLPQFSQEYYNLYLLFFAHGVANMALMSEV